MANETVSVRQEVLKSLIALEKHGKYSNLEVSSSISKNSFGEADKRLYTRLVYGVVEKAVTLDYVISQYSSKQIGKIDTDTLMCLRLGIYQLLYGDKIPDHAAVFETVSLAPRRSKSFVNAVLREFIRNDKKCAMPSDVLKYISVKYSFPKELCRLFTVKFGVERTEKILTAFLSQPEIYLRANTLCASAEELASGELKNYSPICKGYDMISVGKMPTETDGKTWFVEDFSSRLATIALGAKKGETVVDTCAAPGGKSFSIAMDMENEGKLYSFDLHKNKVSLIEKGAERLGISIIEASHNDAGEPIKDLIGNADRVLCDAPCSGLGVIGKKPEIKYKPVEAFKRLPEVQLRVLKGACEYVKDGGILVYSTCTFNPDENEEVVARFLNEREDFVPVDFVLCRNLKSENGMLTVFPYDVGSDGFFIAKFKKVSNHKKQEI